MATTNPFANFGLGNMGQEVGVLSTAGNAFKSILAGQLTKGLGAAAGALIGGENQLGAALMNPSTYDNAAVPIGSAPSPQMNPNPVMTAPVLPKFQLPDLNQTIKTPEIPDTTPPSYTRFLFPAK